MGHATTRATDPTDADDETLAGSDLVTTMGRSTLEFDGVDATIGTVTSI